MGRGCSPPSHRFARCRRHNSDRRQVTMRQHHRLAAQMRRGRCGVAFAAAAATIGTAAAPPFLGAGAARWTCTTIALARQFGSVAVHLQEVVGRVVRLLEGCDQERAAEAQGSRSRCGRLAGPQTSLGTSWHMLTGRTRCRRTRGRVMVEVGGAELRRAADGSNTTRAAKARTCAQILRLIAVRPQAGAARLRARVWFRKIWLHTAALRSCC